MTKSQVFIIFLCIITLVSGITMALQKNQERHLWAAIEKNQHDKNEIIVEWNQLLLQKSSLATGPMLDQNIRDSLDMVIPDPSTIVYIQNDPSINVENIVQVSQ